jgi:hypothetical protein
MLFLPPIQIQVMGVLSAVGMLVAQMGLLFNINASGQLTSVNTCSWCNLC